MGKRARSRAEERREGQGQKESASREGRPLLVLSGQRKGTRHLVYVQGRRVWLPAGLFSALCELVRARAQTGFVPGSPLVICRLRKAVDEALRKPGAGERLIQTGDGAEYRLALELKDAALDAAAEAPEDTNPWVASGRSNGACAFWRARRLWPAPAPNPSPARGEGSAEEPLAEGSAVEPAAVIPIVMEPAKAVEVSPSGIYAAGPDSVRTFRITLRTLQPGFALEGVGQAAAAGVD